MEEGKGKGYGGRRGKEGGGGREGKRLHDFASTTFLSLRLVKAGSELCLTTLHWSEPHSNIPGGSPKACVFNRTITCIGNTHKL